MHGSAHVSSGDLPAFAADVIARLRGRRPRVHCVTNSVAQAFTANILLAIGGYALLRLFESLLFGLPAFVQLFLDSFGLGLFLTYMMTFRGFLFAELHGTTRRSRIYRYKARSK